MGALGEPSVVKINLMIAAILILWSSDVTAQGRPALGGTCVADLDKLCPGIRPGQGRLRACLREHIQDISPPCLFRLAKRLSRNVWRGWMAGARCDSGRLSKPVWTVSCGPRPPVGGIAASTCVTQAM